MMFDFVKLDILDQKTAHHLLNNPLLNFSTAVNLHTGEIINPKQMASFKNMEFTVYPNGRIFITGSLHKLYNGLKGKETNHDVFTKRKVAYTVDYLESIFNIPPEISAVRNLEFGFNIDIPSDVDMNKMLKNFIAFKKQQFNRMNTRGQGCGIDCYLSQYAIKIYNKSLQYSLPNNIMRFEKKIYKMQSEFKGEIYLSDLLDENVWKNCINSLFQVLDDIIIKEPINQKMLNKIEKKVYDLCINPKSWEEFSKHKTHYYKNRYDEIIKKHCLQTMRSKIKNQFEVKANEVLNIEQLVSSDLECVTAPLISLDLPIIIPTFLPS